LKSSVDKIIPKDARSLRATVYEIFSQTRLALSYLSQARWRSPAMTDNSPPIDVSGAASQILRGGIFQPLRRDRRTDEKKLALRHLS
jgi:hypothetical protein